MLDEKTLTAKPLSAEELQQLNAYWRAANYLTACQLYLLDNPLLRRPLTAAADLKKTIVGHWGTCPGQNFIYTHLDRVIKRDDLDMIYLSGPGHGGNAMVAQDWLDGSYTEVYPNITQDEEGMRKLFKRFSFPGGIPSHVAPETPGSIHEGGELGYSLAHAFGAVADNPDLIAACVVGDGEAETGPLATSWHGNKFMSPVTDGAVLPILHLNGFKIANPTIFSRMSHEEVKSFFIGCGWEPCFVEGRDPLEMHQKMAAALDWAIGEIKSMMVDKIENLEPPLAHMIPEGAGHIVLPVVSILALLCIDWRLALASLVTFPLSFLCMGLTFKISGESFSKYDRSASYMNSTIVEYIEGIEVIKAFGRAGVSYEKYAGAINDFRTFVVRWLTSTFVTMKLSFALFPSTLIGTLPALSLIHI